MTVSAWIVFDNSMTSDMVRKVLWAPNRIGTNGLPIEFNGASHVDTNKAIITLQHVSQCSFELLQSVGV